MTTPRDPQTVLRRLERTVSHLLDAYPDDNDFWRVFSTAVATMSDDLDPAEHTWFHSRVDAVLALHGLIGTRAMAHDA